MNRSELKRGKPMARTRMKKKPAPQGFPDQVKVAARLRSGGICEVGVGGVCTGKAAEFHHRKLRRHKDHGLANCLFACKPCHDRIHANVNFSYLMGWLVHSFNAPQDIPVKRGDDYRRHH